MTSNMAAMTEQWEIHAGGKFHTIGKSNANEIIPIIKEGLKTGPVLVNGRRVRIIQRDGKDAWEYVLPNDY